MVNSKIISGRKYWEYDKYYSHEEAYKWAMKLKLKYKGEKPKFRYFIEKRYIFGSPDELFIPGYKYILWINK